MTKLETAIKEAIDNTLITGPQTEDEQIQAIIEVVESFGKTGVKVEYVDPIERLVSVSWENTIPIKIPSLTIKGGPV